MKSFINQAAQGDVLFRKVDHIPSEFQEVKSEVDHIIAHSETGHHHTVSNQAAILFKSESNPMIMFLKLTKPSIKIIHHRDFDTHDTLKAEGGVGSIYEIRRQREYTPEGWRRVED